MPRGMTAIESKNQVVTHGQRTESDPRSLYMFHNNLDGRLEETRMDAPCQHYTGFRGLTTVVQNLKELLALLCCQCKDIKMVDMETEQVTNVFKSPTDEPCCMCSGPDGGLFMASRNGNIMQLDSSFNIINTFNLSDTIIFDMCHLPYLHNTLVVRSDTILRAVSVQDGRQLWSRGWLGLEPDCLLYYSQQDVLLLSDFCEPRVHVVNPRDGSTLQTIDIPTRSIPWIIRMCLCKRSDRHASTVLGAPKLQTSLLLQAEKTHFYQIHFSLNRYLASTP